MAPNLITLLGLLLPGATTLMMIRLDTTYSQELPPWLLLLAALCLFLYQTFDAIDGKQARRTGTSSPLG